MGELRKRQWLVEVVQFHWRRHSSLQLLHLLPAPLAVPPMEDCRRHLYLLRDTHFNAHGNYHVGKALAEFIRESFPQVVGKAGK